MVSAAKRALDYYRPTYSTTTLTPRNGWSWGTYVEGVEDLYRYAGDAAFHSHGMAWGASNGWGLTNAETNPDTIKAGQVYHALHEVDPAASLSAMDTRMAADLASLPLSRYDWIDALFMGLPSWALWSKRTGNPAYSEKLDALYAWTKDRGATSSRCAGTPAQSGLYDAAWGLWYRDCRFVGAKDVSGKPVFWSRGNGWVMAAMADVLRSLPPGDARGAKYAEMLRTMSAALTPLQGADGFWRPSLANAALFPQPEASGTALMTYAMAYGIRAGVLDASTYRPVVARAWRALSSSALQPSGFLTSCQGPGIDPRAPYTSAAPRTAPTATSSGTVNVDSPPFCVGAFLMAATQVARLIPNVSTGRPVTATQQQAGNEAHRVVDGDVTTRWSASPFPQSVTIDLGSAQRIGSTMVVPYLDRAYRYRVEASTDNAGWRVLVDRSANTRGGSQLDDFRAVVARYVRLVVIGVAGASTTWTSAQEFSVHPPPGGTPFGNFESATAVAGGIDVKGWAIDPDSDAPIDISLTVDGVGRSVPANVNRPDVASAFSYGPNHGFRAVISASAGTHAVCATASNIGSGADKNLGCRTVSLPG